MGRQRGFSLIELMIAIALGLIIIGVTAYALRNAGIAVTKTTALLESNRQAMAIISVLTEDIRNIEMNRAPQPDVTGTSVKFITCTGSLDTNMDGTVDLPHELVQVTYRWHEEEANTRYRVRRTFTEYDGGMAFSNPTQAQMPVLGEGTRTLPADPWQGVNSFSITIDTAPFGGDVIATRFHIGFTITGAEASQRYEFSVTPAF